MYDYTWSWGLKDFGTSITLVRVFALVTFVTCFITMFSVCIAPVPNSMWRQYYVFFIALDVLVVSSSCIAWAVFLAAFPPQKLTNLKTAYGWAWGFEIAVFAIGVIVLFYEFLVISLYYAKERRERAEANALPSTIGKPPLSPKGDTYDEFGHLHVIHAQAQSPQFQIEEGAGPVRF